MCPDLGNSWRSPAAAPDLSRVCPAPQGSLRPALCVVELAAARPSVFRPGEGPARWWGPRVAGCL